MGRQALDRKLQALDALRAAPESAAGPLRKALQDRDSFAAAKAAALAGELQQHALVPDLLAAFDRFTAPKADPKCWAGIAIAKALKELGHADPAVFLRGLRHRPAEDAAATLRGTCALALTQCAIPDFEILGHLVEALADPARQVRVDAARAVALLPRPESALLLRLKALTGDRDAEVTGHCLLGLLGMAPRESVAFVARFLENPDPEVRAEAAAALAASHEPGAVEALAGYWEKCADSVTRRGILALLGSSPAIEAAEFLLRVAQTHDGPLAAAALDALDGSRYRARFRERAEAAVKRT